MRPALSPRRLDTAQISLSSPAPGPLKGAIESPEDIWTLLDFDTFVFEPEVLWAKPFDQSGGQIAHLLHALQKRVLWVSHAADSNRQVLHVKLASVNVCTRARDLYSVAYATAAWLRRHRFQRVYLIGGPALEDALISRDISYDGRGSDDDNCACAPVKWLNVQTSLSMPHHLQADSITPRKRSCSRPSDAPRTSSSAKPCA